jgi:chromosome segregation ATPase
MIRRRRPQPAASPPPPWRGRVDAARRIIEGRRADDVATRARLDAVEEALIAATADLDELDDLIAQLDPDRATRELKDALRRRQRNPQGVDDALVATMQRRYETIHGLRDRRSALIDRIDRTVADLEGLAGRSVAIGRASRTAGDDELAALNDDLAALAAAHAELDAEFPDRSGGR